MQLKNGDVYYSDSVCINCIVAPEIPKPSTLHVISNQNILSFPMIKFDRVVSILLLSSYRSDAK